MTAPLLLSIQLCLSLSFDPELIYSPGTENSIQGMSWQDSGTWLSHFLWGHHIPMNRGQFAMTFLGKLHGITDSQLHRSLFFSHMGPQHILSMLVLNQ